MNINIYDILKQFNPDKRSVHLKFKDPNTYIGENMFDSKDSSFSINQPNRAWRSLLLLVFVSFFMLFFVTKAFVLQIIKRFRYCLIRSKQNKTTFTCTGAWGNL
jgi:hypothetical protein